MSDKKILIHLIAGARPNFMKIAPLFHILSNEKWCDLLIVHTGQHFNKEMSDIFFEEFGLPAPSINLGIGGGTHAELTGKTMIAYEKLCKVHLPNLTIVVGDVNASLACAITAKKMGIKLAHLEAGLRSYDRSMPEELNRIIIDSISDILWTPSIDANINLEREGIQPSHVDFVGNIMIDAFEFLRDEIISLDPCLKYNIKKNNYVVVTMHRPVNIDSESVLKKLLEEILDISKHITVIFPIHPRTRGAIEKYDLSHYLANNVSIILLPPLGYVEFMSLVLSALCVVTDSGGIQEETTYLGIPCLTLRKNTERPITVTQGTNKLISVDELIINILELISDSKKNNKIEIDKWDGFTASRVVESIRSRLLDA